MKTTNETVKAIVDEEYEPGVPGRACYDCNSAWPATEPDEESHHHARSCPRYRAE